MSATKDITHESPAAISNQGNNNTFAEQPPNRRKYGFFSLFRYATGFDIFLLLLGTFFAIVEGAIVPLALRYCYSKIVNSMNAYSPCFDDIRKDVETITRAQLNGTLGDLPPRLLAFMNSSNYTSISNYESLFHDGNYSLFADVSSTSAIYAGLIVAALSTAFLHILCWTIAGQRQLSRIRSRLFRALLNHDANWFDNHSSGEVNNLITGMIGRLENCLSAGVSLFISAISMSITGYIISFYTSWLVSIVILSLAPLLFISIFVMIQLVGGYSVKEVNAYQQAGTIASEVLSNIKTVLIFNKQEQEVNRYKMSLGQTQLMAKYKVMTTGIALAFSTLIQKAMVALAFWWGSSPQMHEAVGDISQISLTIMVGTSILASAIPYFNRIAEGSAAAQEIFQIIDDTAVIKCIIDPKDNTENSLRCDIKITNVNFTYPSRPDQLILNNFSLDVANGQTVALVGPSGCGKSTVFQMLLRYYDFSGGEITIDGKDIRAIDVRWLRRQIGFVGQEPVLFNTTLRENIRLGAAYQNEVTDAQIIEACKLANAHNFISALPQKYDTEVGERGVQLSGGQKQRIAIARALISNPSILILDEATSALDTTSEKLVQRAIDKASIGRTTLVIAHRLSTIRNANLIAVVNHGQVTELGDHEALMESKGFYYDLVRTQLFSHRKRPLDGNKNRRNSQHHGIPEIVEVKQANRHRASVQFTAKDISSGEGRVIINLETDNMPASKRPGHFELMKAVLSWGKPELSLTIACAIVAVLAMGAEVGQGILVSGIVSSFCPGDDAQDQIKFFIGISLGLGFVEFILMGLQYYLAGEICLRLTARMRCCLLGKLLRMDATWLDHPDRHASVFTSMLANDCIGIQGLSGARISIYAGAVISLGLSVGFSLAYEYRLVLAILIILVVTLVCALFSAALIQREERAIHDLNDVTTTIAMDALSNIKTVMALGAEQYFIAHFEEQERDILRFEIRRGAKLGLQLPFAWNFPNWAAFVSFLLGSWLMEKHLASFFDVFVVFMLLPISVFSIDRVASITPPEGKAKEAARALLAILAESPNIDVEDDRGESLASKQLVDVSTIANPTLGRIEFKNVTFSYPSRSGIRVLKDVSFTVEPGQHVAFSGPSGSGKSTIIHLIQRLYDPDSGSVLLDGVDIRQMNIRALRNQIGLVSQEPSLFSMTISQNIAYGSKLEPTREEMNCVCRQANVLEFVNTLQKELDTEVGERGAQLSGGQKQRIAIARALIRNPKIFLLDEATSALDAESERVVLEALDSVTQGRTTLTVAHRLSTIQNSDKIFVLSNGSIAEQGTHAELMAVGGIYFKLQQAQAYSNLEEN